jgi:hypothetical protein
LEEAGPPLNYRFSVEELKNLSQAPETSDASWFEAALSGVDFLIQNATQSEIVLYASFGFTFIHGFLVPEKNLMALDFDYLERCYMSTESTWCLEHVSGGGQPDRMYLASPLSDDPESPLNGGEKLIFARSFSSVDKEWRRVELSQQMIHALDIYWMDEYDAFCRLNEEGDIEPIVRVKSVDLGKKKGWLVTILASDLHRYLAVTRSVLVRKFDFTRCDDSFSRWTDLERSQFRNNEISYQAGVQDGASFVNGAQITRAATTCEKLIAEQKKKVSREDRQYASFIAINVKHRRIEELSCAPNELASYFQPESPLPYQITPAFFRPEVLQKYKADPDKYSLNHRSLSCRGGWSLKTFDINKEGQVHTYLTYLGDLPYSEQLYWKSFNEAPKGKMSRRAFETDILGEWPSISDPFDELKAIIRELDRDGLQWWKPRGDSLLATVHYPITTSTEEWGNSILALDQIIVEGFMPSALNEAARERGITLEKNWGSLKILEALIAEVADAIQATEILKPLKYLHDLRTKVKGHSTGSSKDALVKAAIKEFGSLKEHYENLVGECLKSLKKSLTLAFNYRFTMD